MAGCNSDSPPLSHLPALRPRRTKPFQYHLVWAVHNGIERTIRIGVPVIFLGVPLLIWSHGGLPQSKTKQPSPIASSTPSEWEISTCQYAFDIKDYKACLRYAEPNLSQKGLNPELQRSIRYMAMVSSVETGDAANARNVFGRSLGDRRLSSQYSLYAKTKLERDFLPRIESALQEGRLKEASALYSQAYELGTQCDQCSDRLAQARARLSILSLDLASLQKNLWAVVPRPYGSAWQDYELILVYPDSTRCAAAAAKLKECHDLNDLEGCLKVQEPIARLASQTRIGSGPLQSI